MEYLVRCYDTIHGTAHWYDTVFSSYADAKEECKRIQSEYGIPCSVWQRGNGILIPVLSLRN